MSPKDESPIENTLQCEADSSDTVRIKAKEEWLKTLPEIVGRTKHLHALQLMSFLTSSAAGAPHPDGYRVLERKKAGSSCIVPVLSQQDHSGQIWQDLVQNKAGIAFFVRPDIIMLRHNIPLSSLWRGLVLLHEASHAFQFINNWFENTGDNKASEECRVYSFEQRLIEMLFGESYNKIMRKAVVVLAKEKCVSDHYLIIRPGPFEAFTESLDKLYGPPYSDDEKRLRHATFVTHVYFSFFNEYYRDRSEYLRKRFAEMVLATPTT